MLKAHFLLIMQLCMIEWVGPGVDRLCPSFAVDTTGITPLLCNYLDGGTFDVECIVK